MRYLTLAFLAFLLLAAVCPLAVGQAVTEYGLGAGRAATTTAPARSAAQGISRVFDNLSKAAGADAGTAASASSAPQRTAAHKTRRRERPSRSPDASGVAASTTPQPAAPVYEDPKQIQPGIAYDEMVRRFGPPSMLVTTGPAKSTLWYSSGGGTYEVQLEDGKVTAPHRPVSQ